MDEGEATDIYITNRREEDIIANESMLFVAPKKSRNADRTGREQAKREMSEAEHVVQIRNLRTRVCHTVSSVFL